MTQIPSGFHAADLHQQQSFRDTGSINGAAKVTVLPDGTVCTRLRPPHRWAAVVSPLARRFAGLTGFVISNPDNAEARDWYVAEYNAGWQASRRGTEHGPFQDGTSSDAYDDGYLDAAAGRMKWHLTYCTDHDTCGEG